MKLKGATTGCGRSETVMQMLQSGGMSILTDGRRIADIDNPEGYLEWEPIKELPKRPELLRQAEGKA